MRFFRLLCTVTVVLSVSIHGCGGSSDRYMPFVDGRTLHYKATTTGQTVSHDEALTVRVEKLVEMNGRRVAVFLQPPYSRNYYTAERDGIRRIATARGIDGTVTADPDGHYVLRHRGSSPDHWRLTSTLALIEERIDEGVAIRDQRIPVAMTFRVSDRTEEVAVPAGRFTDCLRIDGTGTALVPVHKGETTVRVDVVATDWFAAGVGLVKSVRTETSNSAFLEPGSYVQVLTGAH